MATAAGAIPEPSGTRPPATAEGVSAPPGTVPPAELGALRSATAVRARCELVHRWVAEGRSPHFTLDEARLPTIAGYVAEVIRAQYPDLKIPYHSRWRHFSAGGIDRWSELVPRFADPIERARSAIDLATASVLLDAGAGDAWRYREPESGLVLARSEGLAIAGLDMFRRGCFSSDAGEPCRVDAVGLGRIDARTLAAEFQVGPENPLIGVERRCSLLRGLGAALRERPDLFGPPPERPGRLVDHYLRTALEGRIDAAGMLSTLLEAFASIWPSGLLVQGFPLGDAGRHPAVRTGDATDRIVPLHKLSQWLAYSLIEPLETAGLKVEGLDGLTALAEYRNGGLFIDLGAIRPRQPLDHRRRHEVQDELVVEWRALTVALIERLLAPVRRELGLDAGFAMPHLLQGGTWSAGRKIARALRPPDGPSPIGLATDGTVF